MTHHQHRACITSLCLCLLASTSWGQDIPKSTHIQWGVSAGVNQYKEPDLMQLQGPELGLHARFPQWAEMPNARGEMDVLLGKQRYTSDKSGSMNGVTNFETRWRALWPVFSDTGLLSGVALHTLWNDLRGTTTAGSTTYGGYERKATQLWLPVRWTLDNTWALDAGLLLYGRHSSKLSQVNASYTDIVNTQRRGQYAQASMNVPLNNGNALSPFLRYTHLADSNTVAMNGKHWIEPESHRWQLGATWEFAAP